MRRRRRVSARSIRNLFVAGDVARGLDQISVAMGHAAVAATAIHNRTEVKVLAMLVFINANGLAKHFIFC